MASYPVKNVVGAKEAGYILRADLEALLEKKFPRVQYPGRDQDRFEIRVSRLIGASAGWRLTRPGMRRAIFLLRSSSRRAGKWL
jgi:hypothetical protein